MTQRSDIERHPDIVAMRERYEVAGASTTAQLADGLTLLAGLYLALSPWVVGFTDLGAMTVVNLVTGFAVAALALGFSSAFGRTYGISWVLPALGVWAIIAPWLIRGDFSTTETIWNNVVTGCVIVVLGLMTATLGMARPRRR